MSRFRGIVVAKYFGDHPPPHFHARCADRRSKVAIRSGEVLGGRLTPRATRLVESWRAMHETELLANWTRLGNGVPLEPIDPLP